MEGAGKPRHRSQNPRGEGERAREAIESKPSEFEAIATLSAQHPAIRRFKKSSRETGMIFAGNAHSRQMTA